MTTTYPPRATPTGRTPAHAVSTPLHAVKPPYLMAGCVSLGALILYILTLAPTTQFWDTSAYITAVYTLSLLSIALILWLIVRWDDQPAGEAHDHHLLLIIYLLALTATNHMMGVLVGPVVLVLLFPPLKKNRPVSDQEQKIEWSQFLVFAGV